MDSKQLIAFIPLLIALVLGVIGAVLNKKRKNEFEPEMDRSGKGFVLETSKYEIYRKGIISLAVLCSVIIVSLIIIFFVVNNEIVKHLLFGIVLITFFMFFALRTMPSFLFKCPKCMGRKMKHLSKLILRSTISSKGRKKVFFKCKKCGFEVIEDVEILRFSFNDRDRF